METCYSGVTGDVVIIDTLDWSQKENSAFLTSHVALLFTAKHTDGKLLCCCDLMWNAGSFSPPSGQHEDAQASELWPSCSYVCCRCTPLSSDSPGTPVHMSADQTSLPVNEKTTVNKKARHTKTFLLRNMHKWKKKETERRRLPGVSPPVWRPGQQRGL